MVVRTFKSKHGKAFDLTADGKLVGKSKNCGRMNAYEVDALTVCEEYLRVAKPEDRRRLSVSLERGRYLYKDTHQTIQRRAFRAVQLSALSARG